MESKVHYRDHQSPSTVLNMSQVNSLHHLTLFLKVSLYYYPDISLDFPGGLFSSEFPHARYIYRSSNPLSLT